MRSIICLFLLLSGQVVSANSTNILKVCWELNMKPPYLMRTEKGDLTGIMVDWLNEVLRVEKIKVEHVVRPWSRCLLELKQGKVDIVPNASFKFNRTKYSYYSNPIYNSNLSLFYMEDKFPELKDLSEIDDIKSYVIGGIKGFNYSKLKEYIDVEQNAISRKGLVIMLKKNRVDFAVLQKIVFFETYKDDADIIENIKYIKLSKQYSKKYHILVSKKNRNAIHILKVINAGFSTLIENGKDKEIYNQYIFVNN
jgi:polar amino acid transport system substrate-binding protein